MNLVLARITLLLSSSCKPCPTRFMNICSHPGRIDFPSNNELNAGHIIIMANPRISPVVAIPTSQYSQLLNLRPMPRTRVLHPASSKRLSAAAINASGQGVDVSMAQFQTQSSPQRDRKLKSRQILTNSFAIF